MWFLGIDILRCVFGQARIVLGVDLWIEVHLEGQLTKDGGIQESEIRWDIGDILRSFELVSVEKIVFPLHRRWYRYRLMDPLHLQC